MAISTQDTVHLRGAYRLLSKAYHYKGDTKQRDQYELLLHKLTVTYGYHVDDGASYFDHKDDYIENLAFIYDELRLVEDKEGQFTIEEISSISFQEQFTFNNTIEAGRKLYEVRDPFNNF